MSTGMRSLKLFCVLALVAACLPAVLLLQPGSTWAYTNKSSAKIDTLTTDIYPDESIHLETDLGNCHYTYDKSSIVTYTDSETGEVSFALRDTTGGKGTGTLSGDPLVLEFSDAGSIGGRSVDVTETVQSIDYSTEYVGGSSYRGSYVNFANLSASRLDFGAITGGDYDVNKLSRTYTSRAWKNIDVATQVTYADTGEEVDLPFYSLLADLDIDNTYANDSGSDTKQTKESWTAHNASYARFDIYENHCKLDITDATDAWGDPGTKFSAPAGDLDTDGVDELTETGLIAITDGGDFRSQFTMANCSTAYAVYSQYNGSTEQFAAPAKTVDTSSCYRGDTVTWTVSQQIGTFYQDTFSTYSSFGITDELPKGFEFVSAKVTKERTGDYTASGTLKENGQTISFFFDQDFLDDAANYDGSEYELVIETLVEADTANGSYVNTAVSDISGIEQDCSAVTTVVVPQVSIVKTADAETYQVGDVCTFTLTVNQTNESACGYDVVVRDKLPAYLTYLGDATLSGAFGEVSFEDGTLIVEIPELAYDRECTITFSCRIEDNGEDSAYYTNTATVSVPHGNSDSDDAQVQVLRPPASAEDIDVDGGNDGDMSGAVMDLESIAVAEPGVVNSTDASSENTETTAEAPAEAEEESDGVADEGEEEEADEEGEEPAEEEEADESTESQEAASASYDKTGDMTDPCVLAVLLALALACGTGAYGLRIRRRSAGPRDLSGK